MNGCPATGELAIRPLDSLQHNRSHLEVSFEGLNSDILWEQALSPVVVCLQRLRYYSCMAKPLQFEVPCPCCGALLKIDSDTKAVIAHTPKAVPKTFEDLESAARAMKDQDTRKESIFRQSVEAQKHQGDLLEKKFQEALKRAKETPDTGKPIRDFDLD